MPEAARTGLIAALCALLLGGCDGAAITPGPDAATQGEVQALADAESMLAVRKPMAQPEETAANPEP